MKCIYWNTKNMENLDAVFDILDKEKPDLLFLSEIEIAVLESNQNTLNGLGFEYYPNPGCERVQIIRSYSIDIDLSLQNKYYTTIKIKENNIYVISIHLPSQMYQHSDALKANLRQFRLDINKEIGNSLDTRIIIIGDFNVNPFEKPMIDFDGFGATNSPNARDKITHNGTTIQTYYNPTWQLYTRTDFPGTKFFQRPSAHSYDITEFHYLDQVVISQSLKECITHYRIDIIEDTTNFSFFNKEKNKILQSDHLPLLYEFQID